MRGGWLAGVVLWLGVARPGSAGGAAGSRGSIRDALSFFEKNRCQVFKDPADQLFCGDPELNAIGVRLSAAIQDRLNRIANRPLAIAENAEWVRNRDSSCGIFGTSISYQNIKSIQTCLLRETGERIEILTDPNF